MPTPYRTTTVLDINQCSHGEYAVVAYATGLIHHVTTVCKTCLPAEVGHAGRTGDLGCFTVSRVEEAAA